MVRDAIRAAAKDSGVHKSTLDDVMLRADLFEVAVDGGAILTKEGVGATPKSEHWNLIRQGAILRKIWSEPKN
jgi:hypothetical protein